jgi:choline dehydrogenase-like flavoprotein
MFAGRLRGGEIILHTTPQARTRLKYDGRPKCKNIGTCDICPIGARYSPNDHLQRLEASGQLQILPDTSVRRIVMDSDGRARAVVYRRHGETADREHAARAIVVAAGAIECVRLLLMSSDTRHPGGIGNRFGQVGQHVAFHHVWNGTLRYPKKVFAGRIGPSTAMCHQFRDPPSRGRHGGLHTEFSESLIGNFQISGDDRTGAEALDRLQQLPYLRGIEFHAETVLSAGRAISLSKERDRFGDPFAHLHYESTDFDRVSYRYAQGVLDRFAQLTEGEIVSFLPMEEYTSAAHHMGGCRMGAGAKDSVVDTYGRVHETPNLYVAGSAIFPSCSGSVPPTLTLVALALRTAGAIASALT